MRPWPRLRDVRRDFGREEAANGFVGALFSMTGPVAVILAVGAGADLSSRVVASWIFGVFALNGVLTVLAACAYRQPLAFFWTIPGTVVVGQALTSMPFSDVLGAYVVTALLLVALGLTGQVDRLTRLLPPPVVMAMVAGMFLGFGLGLVRAVETDVAVAAPMVVAFLAVTAVPSAARIVPPVVAALVAGGLAVAVAGRFAPDLGGGPWLAAPLLQQPTFSAAALLELVLPLLITVVVVQNGQGMAVLDAAGHRAPMNVATVACGLWSLPAAAVGAVSTCLTGPTNALLTASGERRRQWTAAVFCGVLAIGFGIAAPTVVGVLGGAPPAFVATLAGLAMLRPLAAAFTTAFTEPAGATTATTGPFAPLVTFLVTVAGVEAAGLGSAFWGLLAGLVVTAALRRT